jgi:predicted ATP-grasp superfamily ATP-dependent carboligase
LIASSRYCRKFFDVSFDADTYEAAITKLAFIIAETKVDWVIPSDARTTRFLAASKHALDVNVFPVPQPEIFDLLNDKSRFIQLCSELGIPHPASKLVACKAQLAEALDRSGMGESAIVKPTDKSAGIGFFKIDRSELAAIQSRIDYAPILLQEFVEGEDISLSLYCDRGEPIAAVPYRRDQHGCDFFSNVQFLEYALLITRFTKFDGVINFDARVSPDGSMALLECNPRFFYPVHATMVAGLNFVGLGLAHPTGGAPGSCYTLHKRVRWTGRFLRDAVTPWKIRKHDVSMFYYKARDPLPLALIRFLTSADEGC